MLFAVYGSPKSYYGNIQYGQAAPPLKNYGGWPDTHPNIQDEPYVPARPPEPIVEAPVKESVDNRITENIAIIKRLKAELAATENIERRQLLRQHIEKARKEKERQFKLRAMIDEEETTFILFH